MVDLLEVLIWKYCFWKLKVTLKIKYATSVKNILDIYIWWQEWKRIKKMYQMLSFLIEQMDESNTYELQECLLRNSCCFIIRKELQNIFRRWNQMRKIQYMIGTSILLDIYNYPMKFTKKIHRRIWYKQLFDSERIGSQVCQKWCEKNGSIKISKVT